MASSPFDYGVSYLLVITAPMIKHVQNTALYVNAIHVSIQYQKYLRLLCMPLSASHTM